MLISERIEQILRDKFPEAVQESQEIAGVPTFFIRAEDIADVCTFMKETTELGFDYLMSETAVDWPEHMEVVYHLYSIPNKHYATLKAKLPRENPVIASVYPVWLAADWQEREVWDMFGIKFEGHPGLTRILTEEGFEGFPLRKDYGKAEATAEE